MPKARSRRKVGRGKILNWLRNAGSKVNDFLKKTKILSKISSNFVGNPYGLAANTAISALGYGRRRVGGNLGHGLKRAGCGRRGRGLTRAGMGRILM